MHFGLVVEGLAHPHEDDVANGPAFRSQHAIGLDDLVQDFVAGELAGQAHVAGGAKPAPDGTADL